MLNIRVSSAGKELTDQELDQVIEILRQAACGGTLHYGLGRVVGAKKRTLTQGEAIVKVERYGGTVNIMISPAASVGTDVAMSVEGQLDFSPADMEFFVNTINKEET